MPANNPYEILGVVPNATADEIKQAYHKLLKQHKNDDVKKLAILQAYEQIKNQAINNNNSKLINIVTSAKESDSNTFALVPYQTFDLNKLLETARDAGRMIELIQQQPAIVDALMQDSALTLKIAKQYGTTFTLIQIARIYLKFALYIISTPEIFCLFKDEFDYGCIYELAVKDRKICLALLKNMNFYKA